MKSFFVFLASAVVLMLIISIPFVAVAQNTGVTGQSLGLFPCNGPDCNFGHVIILANKVINALFVIIMIIAPILIARAGYYYLISSDKPAERSKANGQLQNLVIGLVIIACSYAVVKLVLGVLINQTTLSVTF